MTRKIPHGTINGYHYYRCRCEACKAGRAAYEREHGYNRRVGAVAERKRRADLNLRHPCDNGCGRLVWRDTRVCDPCWRDAVRAATDARRREIQRRWLAGESLRQIALALGSTPASIKVGVVQMRRDGWDMPLRHKPRGKTLA